MPDEQQRPRALLGDDARVSPQSTAHARIETPYLIRPPHGRDRLQQPRGKVLHAVEPVVVLQPRVVSVYHGPAAREFRREPVAQPHLAQVPPAAPGPVRVSSQSRDGDDAIAPSSVDSTGWGRDLLGLDRLVVRCVVQLRQAVEVLVDVEAVGADFDLPLIAFREVGELLRELDEGYLGVRVVTAGDEIEFDDPRGLELVRRAVGILSAEEDVAEFGSSGGSGDSGDAVNGFEVGHGNC